MKDLRRDLLLKMIDYELWANEAWINYLPKFENRKRAKQILLHIVGCHSGWITSVDDWKDVPDEELELERDLPELLRRWKNVVQTRDLDEVLKWNQGKGQSRSVLLHELVHHVMNHGTYHRGHLRGLAESEGLKDFPETDSVGFFIKRD